MYNPRGNPGAMYRGYQPQFNPQQLAQLRTQQIQSLFRKYPNSAVAVKSDKSVIDISVTLRNNQKVVFRVQLPPQFPAVQPAIFLQAQCSDYTYLEKRTSRVVHGTLQSWKPTTDIGALCNQIFMQFITYPPTILRNEAPTMGNKTNVPYQIPQPSGENQPSQNIPMPKKKQAQTFAKPTIPHQIPEIQGLVDLSEVKGLLEDEKRFELFFSQLAYVKNVKEIKEDVRKSNLEAAQKNMKIQKEFEGKSAKLQAKDQEISQMKKMVEDLNKERSKIQEQYQPKFIVQKMDTMINKTEREAKDLVEAFNDGDVPGKDFVKKVMALKKLSYIRKQKNDQFRAKFVKT